MINSAQKHWDKCKLDLMSIDETYSKEETIDLLKNNYYDYFGKSGNRKLIKHNKKLYNSLYYHTSYMNHLNKNLNKFSMRLYILINNIDIYCSKHNCIKFWKFIDKKFVIVCSKCEPKYPSINWFKKTYSNEWEFHYNQRKQSVMKNKTNSIDWFKLKFGDELGIDKYKTYVNDKMNTLSTLKANKYSKISQDLFWNIYNRLTNKNNVYFFELNKEFVLRIPEKYNYNKTVMMLDFIQDKKIIEYNGNYWHSKVIDDVRYKILKDMGYSIMVITSNEYNRNKKSEIIIENCLNFLSCK